MSPEQDILEAKILIIDDDKYLVRLLGIFLKTAGFVHVETVMDSREALAVYTRFKPDLVLLDLVMPHLDGFKVLDQLRSLPGEQPNIMVLTSMKEADTRRKAMDAGARDFLQKPLDRNTTVARIKRLLEGRQRLSRLEKDNQELESFAKSLKDGE